MYTVIVADDEQVIRKLLIRNVDWKAIGFIVVGEAENGMEALELVELLEPDLLLTDIKMPFLNGIDLARQVREVRPFIQIAFLSGFDEFSYAQQAIRYNVVSYMLKPISLVEITAELMKIKQVLDLKFQQFTNDTNDEVSNEVQSFLLPLVLDSFIDYSQEMEINLREEALACHLLHSYSDHQCYVIFSSSFFNNQKHNLTTKQSTKAINNLIAKYFEDYYSFFNNGRVISFIASTQPDFDRYLHLLLEEIDQSVSRILNLQAYIGVSRPINRLSRCNELYADAMRALEHSEKNEVNITFITDIKVKKEFPQEYFIASIHELEKVICSGSMADLEDCLHKIYQRWQLNIITFVVLQFIIEQIKAMLQRIMYSELEKNDSFILPIQQEKRIVDHYEGRLEAWKRCVDSCRFVKQQILEQHKASSILICEEAQRLIDKHYHDSSLSLVSISKEIGVTPTYLSSIVKKTTGIRFIDLVTTKRVEEAIVLLKDENMKVKDVAEKCGYSDQHYFSYSFKKHTGKSPNNYRKEHV